jgi:hypothetical protein
MRGALGILVIVGAVFLGTAATARADLFTFTKIADTNVSGGSFGVGLSTPSINNSGTVAFISSVPGKAGLYVGSGGPLTAIDTKDPFGTFISGIEIYPTINDSGRVAAVVAATAVSGGSIISSAGGPPTTIVTAANPPVGSPGNVSLSLHPSIANDGTVAFTVGHFGGSAGAGVFTGSGGPLTTISANSSAFFAIDPSISKDSSYLAYAPAGSFGDTIYVLHNGVSTPVLKTTLFGFNNIAVNNHGVVIGVATSGVTSELIVGDGKSTLLHITSASGPFSPIGGDGVSINDSNAIAFEAQLNVGSTTGIFTGPALSSKVVETGDALDGSTVTSLSFGDEGLNNQGQVAFWATLADGRQGIYVASSAVPEPSSLVLASITAVGLLGFHWRQVLVRLCHRA